MSAHPPQSLPGAGRTSAGDQQPRLQSQGLRYPAQPQADAGCLGTDYKEAGVGPSRGDGNVLYLDDGGYTHKRIYTYIKLTGYILLCILNFNKVGFKTF